MVAICAVLVAAGIRTDSSNRRWPSAQEEPAASSAGRRRRIGSPGRAPVFAAHRRAAAWTAASGSTSAEPLSLGDLRGRFVLLDFWTYCCINCMHVLPELKKLEHAFPNELVVIGIHSAKFEGEQVTDNIREAALRYEIEHPVVNDAEMTIWRRYGARSWPTLVLIDPAGDVVWAASGERTFEDMKAVIDRGLPYYRGEWAAEAGAAAGDCRSREQEATRRCGFPARCWPTKRAGGCSSPTAITIASSWPDFDGKLQHVIGSGAIGRADGGFDECSFNHPQGMALVGDVLYVADTENHLLRKVDLASKAGDDGCRHRREGNRLAGLGRESRGRARFVGPPKTTPLASPWALWPHGKDLYIAMAGPHQIWKMPLDESEIGPYAGNGREDIVDGPLLPSVPYDGSYSSFAQPSGLASDGKRLFVADSEGSTIRSVPLDSTGNVETLVGLTGTLFDFGDVDGKGRDVRLQHPLGVAWWDGKLYVADTYNNKIKVIDVDERTCRTIAGSGEAGHARRRGRRARRRSTSRPEFRRPAASCTSPTRTIMRFASWSWRRRIGCRRLRLRGWRRRRAE